MGRQPQTKEARALALMRKIVEVEAEIEPLRAIHSELKAELVLLMGTGAQVEEETEPAPRPKKKRKKEPAPAPQQRPTEWAPLPKRIKDFMAANITAEGADMDTISAAVGNPKRQQLRAALVNLTKEGFLTRVGHGRYAPRVMQLPPAMAMSR